MRRALFSILGLLELAVAVVLFVSGWQLPSTVEVDNGFGNVEQVTERTGRQVRLLRDQVHDLRRPELGKAAGRLQAKMRTVARTMQAQHIDFDTIRTMSDSLGDVAEGLAGLADTLDADNIGKLGDGLTVTADFLEEKVAPAASRAADQLDVSTEALRADAANLAALLKEAPLDLKAAREIHDGLARFSDGLAKMNTALKMEKFDTMREGVKGLEDALNRGADRVGKLSGYTYPVMTLNGVKPTISQKAFWPEGTEIAEGLRKAAEGLDAAGKEMDTLGTELPRLRASLDESRKVADRSREALANALRQQDKVEPLLKNIPEQAARLAEQLPMLGSDLSRMLRATGKLKDVAAAMREAQKSLDRAATRWPELRKTLTRSATLLHATQQQMRHVLEHREEYEAALNDSLALTEEFTEGLPQFTQNLDGQLHNQEQSFDELARSIDEVGATLPIYASTARRLVEAIRLLLERSPPSSRCTARTRSCPLA